MEFFRIFVGNFDVFWFWIFLYFRVFSCFEGEVIIMFLRGSIVFGVIKFDIEFVYSMIVILFFEGESMLNIFCLY